MIFSLKMHPIYTYLTFEIEDFDTSNGEILLSVLDSIAQNHYIYKSIMYLKSTEVEHKNILINSLYEQKNDKMMLNYFEKQHNSYEFIDRTILSYYHLD